MDFDAALFCRLKMALCYVIQWPREAQTLRMNKLSPTGAKVKMSSNANDGRLQKITHALFPCDDNSLIQCLGTVIRDTTSATHYKLKQILY